MTNITATVAEADVASATDSPFLPNSSTPEEKLDEGKAEYKYEGFTDSEDEVAIVVKAIEFNVALSRYVKSSRESRQMARLCSELAIIQFYNHGDLGKAQEFLDAISDNYGRKPAYIKWLTTFAPVRQGQNKKLKKDKSETAVEFNLEGALLKPFWEFAPEKEDIVWTDETLMRALRSVVAKHRGDKYVAKDAVALARLVKAEQMIAQLGITVVNNEEVAA